MRETIRLPAVSHQLAPGFRIALDSIDIEVGERLVLFGPNGAGKTTALRLLAGMLGSGSGIEAAYLQQRPYMFRGSAHHNMLLGLDSAAGREAERLARRLAVSDKLGDDARNLSGGERQRVALARVLAAADPIVLLDEPLSAIDVRHRDLVTAVIADELRGRAAIIVTHDRDVVASLADTVAVMLGGSVRQMGSVDEVFTLPADDEVALAVGLGNVLSGTVIGREDPMVEVDVDGVRIWGFGEQPRGTAVKVLFGAEAVTVHTGVTPSTSARNVWSGEIIEVRPVGRLVELVVNVGPRVAVVVTPGSFEALELRTGSRVGLTLKATAVHAVAAPAER